LEDLVPKVVPPFVHLVPRLIDSGFIVGVVTFSDSLMKTAGASGWAGEGLVTDLLNLTFTNTFEKTLGNGQGTRMPDRMRRNPVRCGVMRVR
jgi:hypothetical protein